MEESSFKEMVDRQVLIGKEGATSGRVIRKLLLQLTVILERTRLIGMEDDADTLLSDQYVPSHPPRRCSRRHQ